MGIGAGRNRIRNTTLDLALSPDGCFLLFVRLVGGIAREVDLSVRDTDGRFTSFVPVASASTIAPLALAAALTPQVDAMYVVDGTVPAQVFRGTPP